MSQEKSSKEAARELQVAQEINRIMRARVEKLNKASKTTIIVGSIVAIVVVIYMSVLYSQFSDMVKAENLERGAR